jgi:hypothetical protein
MPKKAEPRRTQTAPHAPAATTHALLSFASRPSGSLLFDPGQIPDEWVWLRPPPEVPPLAEKVLRDAPYAGVPAFRRYKVPPAVLPTGKTLEHLIVHRALGDELLGAIGPEWVRATPVSLIDAKGPVSSDYLMLEAVARVPLDRRAAQARWTEGDAAAGSLAALELARWGADRTPRAPFFRLLDRPHHLFLRRDLADRVRDAQPKFVALDDYAERHVDIWPERWSFPSVPAYRVDPAEAEVAEAAFWQLMAGATDGGARARALVHPRYAYAVAACLDRGPADDTRAAACRSSLTAALYAAEIDRAARPDTRAAAIASSMGAQRYATHVDLALTDEGRARLIDGGGYDAPTLAELDKRLSVLRGFVASGGAPAAAGEARAVARRELELHDVARYVADAGPPQASSHAPIAADVRSDIDAFIRRGYAAVGCAEENPSPADVVEGIFRYVGEVQSGARKLAGKAKTAAQMELGCAFGEQLRRVLGWQWADVRFEGGHGLALLSPDRAHAHFPFAFIGERLKKGGRRNTIALLFNMLTAGPPPPAAPFAYQSIA